jgi:hypothetical protein
MSARAICTRVPLRPPPGAFSRQPSAVSFARHGTAHKELGNLPL